MPSFTKKRKRDNDSDATGSTAKVPRTFGVSPGAAARVFNAAEPRRSTRPKRQPSKDVDHVLKYFDEPKWSRPIDNYVGGCKVTATLGPAATQPVNRGSVPEGAACKAVNDLNRKDPENWIKGHLLNDNLGGPGKSKNLTPLSRKANADMSVSFEKEVKDFVGKPYSEVKKDWANMVEKIPLLGVEIKVEVLGRGTKKKSDPRAAVARSVRMSAKSVPWQLSFEPGGEPKLEKAPGRSSDVVPSRVTDPGSM